MSRLASEYVSKGFSDVVVTSSTEEERDDSAGTEIITEQIVARRGSSYVRATGEERKTFGPRARHRVSVYDIKEIPREEYDVHCGKQVL